MSTLTFDTHKFVKRLEAAGVPPLQAEAMADAQKEVLAEALETQLASRADLVEIRHELREAKAEIMGELRLNRWMLGVVLGLAVANFGKQFF